MSDETKNETTNDAKKELTIFDFATLARAEVLRSFCVDAAKLDEWFFHRQALRVDIGRPRTWFEVLDVAYTRAENYAFERASIIGPMNFMVNFKIACERIEQRARIPAGIKSIVEKMTRYPADVEKIIEEESARRASIERAHKCPE